MTTAVARHRTPSRGRSYSGTLPTSWSSVTALAYRSSSYDGSDSISFAAGTLSTTTLWFAVRGWATGYYTFSVTTGTSLLAAGAVCSTSSTCSSSYCAGGRCCSTSAYCSSGSCT